MLNFFATVLESALNDIVSTSEDAHDSTLSEEYIQSDSGAIRNAAPLPEVQVTSDAPAGRDTQVTDASEVNLPDLFLRCHLILSVHQPF